MDVKISKGGNTHICHSEEQLKRFLAAGWVANAEPVEEAKPKKTTKSK